MMEQEVFVLGRDVLPLLAFKKRVALRLRATTNAPRGLSHDTITLRVGALLVQLATEKKIPINVRMIAEAVQNDTIDLS